MTKFIEKSSTDRFISSIARVIESFTRDRYIQVVYVAEISRVIDYDVKRAEMIVSGESNGVQYPVDTLIKGKGICVDGAVLVSSILRALGVDHSVIELRVYEDGVLTSTHAVLGVSIPPMFNKSPMIIHVKPINRTFYVLDATPSRETVFPEFGTLVSR